MISHWDDVPWKRHEYGELRVDRKPLSRSRGQRGATLSRWRIDPGARSTPQHVHIDEEEIFFVLGGSGFSWQGDALYEIRAGDALIHRADEQAHTLIAADGDEPLDVLAYASGSPTGLTVLPRAGVSWVGIALAAAGRAAPVRGRAAGRGAAGGRAAPADDRRAGGPRAVAAGPRAGAPHAARHRPRRRLAAERAAARDGHARAALVGAPLPLAATMRSSSSWRAAARCCSATSASTCGPARSSTARRARGSRIPSRPATTGSCCSPTAPATRPTPAGIRTRASSPGAASA